MVSNRLTDFADDLEEQLNQFKKILEEEPEGLDALEQLEMARRLIRGVGNNFARQQGRGSLSVDVARIARKLRANPEFEAQQKADEFEELSDGLDSTLPTPTYEFSPESRRFVLATNAGGEMSVLTVREAATFLARDIGSHRPYLYFSSGDGGCLFPVIAREIAIPEDPEITHYMEADGHIVGYVRKSDRK